MAKLKLLNGPPTPGVYQEFETHETRFGWVMRPFKKFQRWRHLVPLRHWTKYAGKPIVQINREWLAWAAYEWKNNLTGGQRTAWENAASAASWTAYHGIPAYAGGFELFIHCQRHLGYLAFNPYQAGAGVSMWYQDTPPDPWDPPPAPTIIHTDTYDGGVIEMELGNCPDIHTFVIAGVVSQRRNVSHVGRKTTYITAFTNTIAVEPDKCWVDFFLEYPFLPNLEGDVSRVKIGLRWYNFLTLQFGEITWVAL